jgi:histidinol phosphatase-like PHP family hydrolase
MSDGALPAERVVAVANARGVLPSITDHITTDGIRALKTLDEVAGYLDVIESLDVGRGGELCWHDRLWRDLPDDLVARFTHRLGSLHAVWLPDGRLVNAFSLQLPAGVTPRAYLDALVANAERLTREMPVDILAHPTLVPIPMRDLPAEELWTEEQEERLVDALHAAGIAFELSNRYRCHERIARRAMERGVRLALGSDGHAEEQVANLDYPLVLAARIGARREELYDPLVHGSRTLDRAARGVGGR